MSRLICAFVFGLLASMAQAQSVAGNCETQAVGKNGKELAGAARTAFLKKCNEDRTQASCEARAVSKDGKPLFGAAKEAFMKKCEADSDAVTATAESACAEKAVSKTGKPLSGAAKTKFMEKCLREAGTPS